LSKAIADVPTMVPVQEGGAVMSVFTSQFVKGEAWADQYRSQAATETSGALRQRMYDLNESSDPVLNFDLWTQHADEIWLCAEVLSDRGEWFPVDFREVQS
jgi:hypothetical protein